jgi:hypothetical protein
MFSNIYEDLENEVTGYSIIYGWKRICFTIYVTRDSFKIFPEAL